MSRATWFTYLQIYTFRIIPLVKRFKKQLNMSGELCNFGQLLNRQTMGNILVCGHFNRIKS